MRAYGGFRCRGLKPAGTSARERCQSHEEAAEPLQRLTFRCPDEFDGQRVQVVEVLIAGDLVDGHSFSGEANGADKRQQVGIRVIGMLAADLTRCVDSVSYSFGVFEGGVSEPGRSLQSRARKP